MDWNLLSYVPMIFLAVVFLAMLAYAWGHWKNGNKFAAFLCLAVAVGLAIGFYAIYGKRLFG